ncbi:cilia- and flagella-associated protein 298-like [Dysidea avara]|uniref:cilia- and flagella-associated protein 298-like n=1 Tax=Dysidea avara TaxID=196820 RepID=UPI00332A7A39
MVKIHVKRGDENRFLFETNCGVSLNELTTQLARLHNGMLKVSRLCQEIELLADHGVLIPPQMQGLTDEQVSELHLIDEWVEKCVPSGGSVECADPVGRRNGKAPNEKMKEVLRRTVSEAKAAISKDLVEANVCMTEATIKDTLDKLSGAVTIVYPMGLPPHDPIRMEFEGTEDLTGTQASKEVLDEATAQLWWAGKELTREKSLGDFIGKNEKTKIIAKLQKKGQGAPGREPVFSEEEKKQMMFHAYHRQEELKKLETTNEDQYLNSEWSDPHALKKQFTGLGNISWRPK